MELLEGDAHMKWMKQLKVLGSSIGQISDNEDIDKQRLAFATFNATFYKSIKSFGFIRILFITNIAPWPMATWGHTGSAMLRRFKTPISVMPCCIVGKQERHLSINTKMIEVTYNPEKIDIDKIHQAIAETGHDTGKHKASTEVYDKLPGCCKYERMVKETGSS